MTDKQNKQNIEERVEAAQVIIYRQHKGEYQVLLTKRPDHFRNFRGMYVFPGGKREPEHRSLEETAVIEVDEEVALKIREKDLEYAAEFTTTLNGNKKCDVTVYATELPKDQQPKLSDEVEHLFWATPSHALSQDEAGKIKIPPKTKCILYALVYVGKPWEGDKYN